MQLFYFSDVFSIRPVGKVISKMLIEPNSELNWFRNWPKICFQPIHLGQTNEVKEVNHDKTRHLDNSLGISWEFHEFKFPKGPYHGYNHGLSACLNEKNHE